MSGNRSIGKDDFGPDGFDKQQWVEIKNYELDLSEKEISEIINENSVSYSTGFVKRNKNNYLDLYCSILNNASFEDDFKLMLNFDRYALWGHIIEVWILYKSKMKVNYDTDCCVINNQDFYNTIKDNKLHITLIKNKKRYKKYLIKFDQDYIKKIFDKIKSNLDNEILFNLPELAIPIGLGPPWVDQGNQFKNPILDYCADIGYGSSTQFFDLERKNSKIVFKEKTDISEIFKKNLQNKLPNKIFKLLEYYNKSDVKNFHEEIFDQCQNIDNFILFCRDIDQLDYLNENDEDFKNSKGYGIIDWIFFKGLSEIVTRFFILRHSNNFTCIPFVDVENKKIEYIQINDFKETNIGSLDNPKILFDYYHIFDPSYVYSNNWSESVMRFLDPLKSEIPSKDIEARIDAILKEAMSMKQGTIPYKAIIQIPSKHLSHITLTEFYNYILFSVHIKTNNDYLIGKINTLDMSFDFGLEVTYLSNERDPEDKELISCGAEFNDTNQKFLFEYEGEDKERILRSYLSLKLIVSSIIRDFWVVEERSKIFDQSNIKLNKKNKSKTDNNKPSIVYIPRKRYNYTYLNKEKVQNFDSSFNFSTRVQHFVRAHKRKSNNASDDKKSLARVFGIELTDGYTFVRPHERGGIKKDVIYRSRSASEMLYSSPLEKISNDYSDVHWFKFEKMIYDWCKNAGYEVVHTGGSGDGNIDVYATKKNLNNLSEEWIIQCKRWSRKRIIGPDEVLKMIGTIKANGSTARGVIVATTNFGPGAISLAQEHDIELITL